MASTWPIAISRACTAYGISTPGKDARCLSQRVSTGNAAVGWAPGFPTAQGFLVVSGEPGPVFTTWVVSVVGGVPRLLREDAGVWDVSPDGSYMIAFTTNAGRVDHREIWLTDANGGNPRRFPQVDEDSALQLVRWSPDGHRLAYGRFPTLRRTGSRLRWRARTWTAARRLSSIWKRPPASTSRD